MARVTDKPKSGSVSPVGEWIAARRKVVGVSQAAICAATGLSPATLSKVEHGHQEPTGNTLQRIAPLLKVSYELLWAVRSGEPVDPANPPMVQAGLTSEDIVRLHILLELYKDQIDAELLRRQASAIAPSHFHVDEVDEDPPTP